MDCFNWSKTRDIVIIVAIVVVAVYASFHWIVGGDIRPNHYTYQHHLRMDSVQIKKLNDTLYLHQMMDRADSICNATKAISDRYQDDVNLMIYKATQWFTIWLGIMAIVVGGITVNQYYNHRRVDAEKKELQEKLDEYTKETSTKVKERIDGYQSIVNQHVVAQVNSKMGEINTMRKEIGELNETLKNTYRDIKISSLVTCISTFPDPSMFTSKPEKKEYLRYYLRNLHDEFKDFVSKFKEGEQAFGDVSRLAVVLTSVKYVLVRSRSIFPGYHQNITYNQLCKTIDKPLKNIVNGEVKKEELNNDLTRIVEVFGKMIRDINIEGTTV